MRTLGILGGGQLARMTSQAAGVLGIDVWIADLAPDSPAARVSAGEILLQGRWTDVSGLQRLAKQVECVTLESEFVDAPVLDHLETLGVQVLPTPRCVRVVQDKLLQKQALAGAGLAVPTFRVVNRPEDVSLLAEQVGWPVMLKARRDGYDGHGNVVVHGAEEADAACLHLGWPGKALYAEAIVAFERELAVMVVRGKDGSSATYPVVETRQDPRLHICREVLAPADLPEAICRNAARLAERAVGAVEGVGAFGVELFLESGGLLSINELAPRPHNSGHYSIEGCATSQFANHVRAVVGLPLGDPSLVAPAVVMVNLLGTGVSAFPTTRQLGDALAFPGTAVHLYGKMESRPGRKMGHVTALGDHLDVALGRARGAAACLPL